MLAPTKPERLGHETLQGTRPESLEEIRQATRPERIPAAGEALAVPDTQVFRPRNRMPLALLCVLDDGSEDGEWIRLRSTPVVIGRAEGEVLVPHDGMMSSRHAELSRQRLRGEERWVLSDLDSTNGTFVRVTRAFVRHGQELQIGSRRLRFETATDEDGHSRGPQERRGAALVELTPHGEGERFALTGTDHWIGREPALCSVVLLDDPRVSRRHARLSLDRRGSWRLENAGARNGTWLRIRRIAIDSALQFQLGEQRFLVRAL